MTSMTTAMTFELADAEATQALGVSLARSLPAAVRSARASAVLHLRGELGAGKTTCVRGLLRALGVTGLVRSPTYTLAETYELAPLTCIHVDLYRLQSASEIEELGLRDSPAAGCLLLIEWPEKGGKVLPAADVVADLVYLGESRQARLASFTSVGAAWLGNLGLDAR
jgi:tRNA threonylcarbamoyladenosine biosynthesis protein TsaE